MEKKPRQRTSLTLRRETLRQLDNSDLRAAAGGVRMWRPVGYANDTTPVYDWVDDTNG